MTAAASEICGYLTNSLNEIPGNPNVRAKALAPIEEPMPDWLADPPEEIEPLIETPDRRYVIAARVLDEETEERIDEEERKTILDLIDTLHKGAGGDYEVQLKSGRRLRVSRSRLEALEKKLGVT